MTIKETDTLIVQHNGTPYKVEQQNIMDKVQDDDLLIVGRDADTYKVTFADLKEGLPSGNVPVVIETVALSENDDGNNDPRYTDQSFTATVNTNVKATEPILYSLKAKSEGNLVTQAQTSVITEFDDASKQLTFAGPEGLTEFTAGDEVVQNGGGTPVTSEITNVAGNVLTLADNTNLANFRVGDALVLNDYGDGATWLTEDTSGRKFESNQNDGHSWAPGRGPDQVFTTSEAVSNSNPNGYGGFLEFIFPEGLVRPTDVLHVYARVDDGSQSWSGIGVTSVTDLGNSKKLVNHTDEVKSLRLSASGSNSRITWQTIELNGIPLYDGDPVSRSVLINSIDSSVPSVSVTDGGIWNDGALANWNQDKIWSNPGSVISSNPFNTSNPQGTFDGYVAINSGVNVRTDSSNASENIVFNNLVMDNSKVEIIYSLNRASTNIPKIICGDQENTSASSDPLYTGEVTDAYTFVSTLTGCTGSTIELQAAYIAGQAANTTWIYQIIIDDMILVDEGVTPPGDSFVTGPTFEAATGTVASIDSVANTMTLSASDGRWLVTKPDYQEDLKLNKVAQSPDFVEVDDAELFAIFNDQGVITDMSGTDPGYRQMSGGTTTFESFNLQFPSLFSNGKTPDETLPEGASLCVDVKAQNSPDPAVFSELTDTCITPEAAAPGPKAVMHGLRLDGDRETYLNNALSTSTVATYSVWFKPTGDLSTFHSIISNGTTPNTVIIGYNSSQNGFYSFSNGAIVPWNSPAVANQWHHLVLNVDGTNATAYVNGNKVVEVNDAVNLNCPDNVLIGTNGSVTGERMNGYLSELYVVDGQTLPPTAFGYDFENNGKWAPLENTVIKQNIGDFGANGFYLPFDPAATEGNQSQYLTSLGDGAFYTPERAFDGNTDTAAQKSIDTTNTTGVITYTPPSAIAVSSLEVYMKNWTSSTYATAEVFVNGNKVIDVPDRQNGWLPVPFTGSLNSIAVNANYVGTSSHTIDITGYKINGNVLVDHNSIGVDDSGNDNHFNDQNFAVGNTSRVWSSDITITGGTEHADLPNTYGFDGCLSNPKYMCCGDNGGNSIATYTFNPPIGNGTNDKVEIYWYSGGTHSVEGQVNGVDFATQMQVWQDVGSRVNSVGLTHNQGFGAVGIYGIRLNGELLIDKNAVDTVLDTPMKNYAVLESGNNGNLKATSATSITYLGEAGTDYYYEEDGGGKVHTGGAAFTSASGKTYNFGQQPFMREYDDSQLWRNSVTQTGTWVADRPIENIFTGELNNTVDNPVPGVNAGSGRLVFNPPITGGLIEINGSSVTNDLVVNDDNSNKIRLSDTSFSGAIWDNTNVTSLSSLDLVGTSNPATYIRAIRVDGKILIDSDSAIAGAYGNNLFQTWLEWNNISVFQADNPAHVAKFNAIKEALEAYEGDKQEFRNSILTKMAKSLTEDELTKVLKLL